MSIENNQEHMDQDEKLEIPHINIKETQAEQIQPVIQSKLHLMSNLKVIPEEPISP